MFSYFVKRTFFSWLKPNILASPPHPNVNVRNHYKWKISIQSRLTENLNVWEKFFRWESINKSWMILIFMIFFCFRWQNSRCIATSDDTLEAWFLRGQQQVNTWSGIQLRASTRLSMNNWNLTVFEKCVTFVKIGFSKKKQFFTWNCGNDEYLWGRCQNRKISISK